MESHKIHVPNHQPEIKLPKPASGMISPSKKMSITRLMNTASFTMALLILAGPWPILQAAKAGMRSQSSTLSTSQLYIRRFASFMLQESP